ncbi:hypothetical protein [Synechococcus sp. UW105]|uniref:hypothetical protein n=1 Tax=Synechococcus sp. UW105 TaxID=337067 RepID=UPI001482C1DE|nr:hypothetical protein [Synechococcus sp. UW105]
MTTSNYAQSDFSADDQIVELTEAQLEAVEGGGVVTSILLPIVINEILRRR